MYVGKWKNDRRHGRGTMTANPVLNEERTGGLPNDALHHTFSVDAVWENGVRVRYVVCARVRAECLLLLHR